MEAAAAVQAGSPTALRREATGGGGRAPPAARGDVLKVVGGAGSGGLIVRAAKDTASLEAGQRLSVGSLVEALECDGGRLSYHLLEGSGPATGWVSLSMLGKPLLLREEGVPPEGCNGGQAVQNADAALRWYSKRLLEGREAGKGDFIFDRQGLSLSRPRDTDGADAAAAGGCGARADLELQMASEGAEKQWLAEGLCYKASSAEDSDGEVALLCRRCRLPLGDFSYALDSKREALMHGECAAQVMLQDLRGEEEASRHKEAALKKARRERYDIGWKAAAIPRNKRCAGLLGCAQVPQGMCCLVLQGENSVRIAPTFEPAGALNLEYVSVALQVRRLEGREPFFSLDPVEAARPLESGGPETSMQLKRFEPEWLAATSVGEVMFQADYHLKELSMGEHEQPVVGMKSCFDYSEKEGFDKDWSAREWFVVRKAEIQVSEDAVLIPYLKMGIEAREQILGPNGLEDAPLTRPNHPLVKYAEAFTHNFDLIAERKSVVSQLREVAKASIIAKFMLESNIDLEESWFSLGDQTKAVCCLEVPQLWNDRCPSKIHVQDGSIVTTEGEGVAKIHSVYGGVDFGIDRFRLAAPSRIATSVVAGRAALGRPASTLMATSQAGLSMGPTRQFTRLAAPLTARASLTAPSRLAAPLSARAGLAAPISAMSAARPAMSLMATSRLSVGAPRAGLAAPLSAISAARPATSLMATSRLSMAAPQVATARLSMGMPRGVDLNLDRFNLSVAAEAGTWACSIEAPGGLGHLAITGKAFWSSLDGAPTSVFQPEDKGLLAEVFNPHLSDRREEGDHFLPPSTSLSYMHKLKTLVKEEASVRQRRKEQFFSTGFAANEPGPLFPSSWTSAVELAQGPARAALLLARPEFLEEEALLLEVLGSAVPVFDQRTEEGVHFLIYRVGSLEVRATRASDGRLAVGAVFSAVAEGGEGAKLLHGQRAAEGAKIMKVTEYVEKSHAGSLRCRSYVVLEAEGGHVIVTERLMDGSVAWTEGPEAIEDRNSLARVTRLAECAEAEVTVGQMRAHWALEASRPRQDTSPSVCKRYARAVFRRAAGEA